MKSSSRMLREAPVEVVREVWAVMASAGRCIAGWWRWGPVTGRGRVSTAIFVRCPWGRGIGAVLRDMKMVPNTDSAAALVWACFELPCTLRGSAPPCRSVGTCAAGARTTELLPDVVVSAGETLRSGTAVEEAVSPSWPRDRAADAADVSAAVVADIAAAAAAAAAMGAAVVAAAAAQGASVAGDPVAGCVLDHRRGA